MSAHWATLEYATQPLQACSTEQGPAERSAHKRFAEDQGCLSHQWLSLQEKLRSQVRRPM